MKTFAKTLLGLSLLLPLAACPSDDDPGTDQVDAGQLDAGQLDGGPLPPPAFTACEADLDKGKDGTIDGLWVYSYKDGNFLRDELDLGQDGVLDETYDYVYVGDNMTHFEYRIRDEKSGELKLAWVDDYTHDAEGRILTTISDTDGDGVVNRKTTVVRDADGRAMQVQTDTGNDGTIDTLRTNVYVDGLLDHADVDRGNDGTLDDKITYAYDSEGREIREELDRANDGSVDRLETRTYESHGWLATLDTDYENDGVFDYSNVYTYADGKPATYEYTYRVAGEPDDVNVETFRYECGGEKPVARQDRARVTAEIRAEIHAARR